MISIGIAGAAVPHWSRRDIAAFVRRVLHALAKAGHIDHPISEVSIAFVDDPAMIALNAKYRHKARTTDVLTFPADASYAHPSSPARPLGDIVISLDQARRQARGEHHSLPTEIRYLLLHGILHALGHDHETDQGEMNALELEMRAAVGLD